jgi:hypothetical protein
LLKAFACLVMIIGSRRISIAECSRSGFALAFSYVQVRIFFLLSVKPTRDASERSKPTRVGNLTRIHRLRAPMDDIFC